MFSTIIGSGARMPALRSIPWRKAVPAGRTVWVRLWWGLVLGGLLCGFLWPVPAAAVEVEDLYVVTLPVTGQGEAERQQALRQAFAEVLVRVSGDPEAPQVALLQEALRRPLGYVQQYVYRPPPPPAPALPGKESNSAFSGEFSSEAGSESGGEVGAGVAEGGQAAQAAPPQFRYSLRVSFDPEAVSGLLTEAGVPVWGRARPAILLWLAVEQGGQRLLVGGEQGKAWQERLRREARRRGLRLLFPLLDLEDQAAVRFADVWGDFAGAIQRASRRYQSTTVLVGRLYARWDGIWEGRWSLYEFGKEEDSTRLPLSWALRDPSPSVLLAAGVDGTADRLARRYAQLLDLKAANAVTLRVEGVRTLAQYARVLRYLQSLDPVERLRVLAVEEAAVVFEAGITGTRRSLQQTIAFGGTLAPLAERRLPFERPPVQEPPWPASGTKTARVQPSTAFPDESGNVSGIASGIASGNASGSEEGGAGVAPPGLEAELHYRLLP